jgi:predicted permease
VYKLVVLLEAAVPGAVTLLVVCMRVYPDIAPLSQMLFWQYVASAVTLPLMLIWFLGMPGVVT